MEYDAIVIGTGPGGESVIGELAENGRRVAAIEKDLIGGECAYWGCIPSKTLLRPGTIRWETTRGFGTSETRLDWPTISNYRNYMVRGWDDSKQVADFKDQGVAFYRGTARIAGPGKVSVNGEVLAGKNIVVATGSEPSVPPIPGLKEVGYWTNREGTSFQGVPESVLIVGGGAVGAELAQALHNLGARLTVVEGGNQLLGRENPDAAEYAKTRFEAIGITVLLGRKTVRFEMRGSQRVATLDNGDEVAAEIVLVATGRRPRVKDLGLGTIGIEEGGQGIKVDEHCRVSKGVWAVGDVTGISGFTHTANYQGQIVAANIMGNPRVTDYRAIPAVTFIDPEVASVGVTSQDRAPEGIELVSGSAPMTASSRAYTYGEGYEGGLRIFADKRNRVLVGAWAVGPLAGEWIQFALLAIRAKVPVDVLDDTIPAFPTFTRLYLTALKDLRKKL